MGIKNAIRERRQHRIRQIQQNRQPPNRTSRSDDPSMPTYRYNENSDPEWEWKKQRSQLWRGNGNGPRSKAGLINRLIVSVLLYGLVWGIFHSQSDWSVSGQQSIRSILNQNFDFVRVESWYAHHFQSLPAWLPKFSTEPGKNQPMNGTVIGKFYIPVVGKMIRSENSGLPGIFIQTNENSPVAALNEGRVVYVGQKEDTGLTVEIQYTGGYRSVYGFLQNSFVQPDDWVQGGQSIGTVNTNKGTNRGLLYFSMQKDGKVIDPTDVVKFD